MDLKYQYRWAYWMATLILMVIVGYSFILRSDLSELSFRKSQKFSLQTKLQDVLRPINADSQAVKQKEVNVLAGLTGLLQKNKFSVQTVAVKPVRMDSANGLQIVIVALGAYEALQDFLQSLNKEFQTIFITNLQCKMDADAQFMLRLTLLHLPSKQADVATRPAFNSKRWNNPFCLNADRSAVGINIGLKQFSVKQMRLLGFLAINAETHAFLQLPNKQILDVKKGMRLGNEGGEVVAIRDQSVTVAMPDHRFQILRINT